MASSKKTSIIIKIITPIFIFAICAVIVAILAIKPYNKASMYLDIAFMDTLKTQANDGSVAGLTIKENEIIEDDSLSTSDTGEVIWPAFAEQYAVLKSDALELSIPVYWGISSEILEKGACQQSDSTILGNNGNTVISAHVNTFFSDLGKLKDGDKITLTTKYGYFTYEVTELIEFNKKDKKYLIPTTDSRLTLYTCKNDILGATEMRTGVVCKQIEKKFYTQ